MKISLKKSIAAASLAVAVVSCTVPCVTVAAAEELIECDRLFEATVSSLIDSSSDSAKLTALRKPVYDIEVNPLGYVYEFEIGGEKGYALFTAEDGNFVPREVMPGAASPYAEAEGTCIYVSGYNYLEYSDGEYRDIESGEAVSGEVIEVLAENAVYGGEGIMLLDSDEIIYEYVNKTKDNYEMAYSVPYFHSSPFLSSCAAIAGANIIAFHDRYHDDLIPDYTPGSYVLGTLYRYKQESARITELVTELYYDMETDDEGTTLENFKKGMQKYCARYGFNISFNSCMSGKSFNYSSAQNHIKNLNQPVALFLSNYNVGVIIEGDNYDKVSYYYVSNVNHVMVGFGYRQLTFTYSSGSSETLNFIYVASCNPGRPYGYFNPSYNVTVNDAFAINIY